MLSRFFSGKKNGFVTGLLIIAMCLPLCSGALAASVPSAPEGLTAAVGSGQVGLIWFTPDDDGGAAITGYHVSMDGGATWIDVGLATSYTFDGLTGGIIYVFAVRAVNDAGYGEEAIVNAKPKDAKPDANATGNQQGQGQVIPGGGSRRRDHCGTAATPAAAGGSAGHAAAQERRAAAGGLHSHRD